MNLAKARELKKFAEKFNDPHVYLVAHMSACTDADALTVPLHAYQLLYPKASMPDTPMFQSAHRMIENALYNETLAWALSLTGDVRTLEGIRTNINPETPSPRLVSDYNTLPPSDAARAQAKEKRKKEGTAPPHNKTVLTKNPHTAARFSQSFPKHWQNPGFGRNG